ncbi:MAG: PDZ domain-containing protein [Alphaproteobacteria bacterium]|nr:PDZ domain-containing protein [Alphaproteobacteria bacterium]
MYLLRFLLLIGLLYSVQPLMALQQPLTFSKVSYAPIVKKVAPAVVSISTQQRVHNAGSLFGNDPFFNFFFGDNLTGDPHRQGLVNSLGSGVIVDPSGIVVTCAHVIKNAQKIVVHLSDNREFEGEVILKDMQNDLAAIGLKRVRMETPLPSVYLEESDIEVGDLILVIGNPFGVGQTVTNGIISAIARNVRGRMLIQTDAPINPGNSGGALISMNGNLIGIPNAILSKTGVNHGIGFAIPSVMIRNLLNSINAGGKIIRPWAGIEVQRLTNDLASSLGLQLPLGVLVVGLHPSSPARAAGLAQGDVITHINNQQIVNPEEFIYRIQSIPLGQQISFDILRGQQKVNIQFYPIDPPAFPAPQKQRLTEGATLLNDIEVANLSPALIVQYQLPFGTPEQGVIITDTGKNQLAARLNLSKGDIIEEVNGQALRSVDELINVLSLLHGRINSIKIRQGDRRIEVKHQ